MESPRSAGHQPGLEQRKIIDTLARLRDRPPPTDPSAAGCVIAVSSIVTLALLPFAGRWFNLSGGAAWAIGIGLGLVSLLGGALGIYGGMFYRGAVSADVQEAIRELMVEWPGGNPAVIREAALRILDGWSVSTGPTSVETFDAKDVATRLGPALDYVLGVQHFLLERHEIYQVFTVSG